VSKGLKLRRGRAVDQDHEGRWIHTHIVDRGFVSRSSKLLQQNCDIAMRYPDRSEPRWDACQKIKEVGVPSEISEDRILLQLGIAKRDIPTGEDVWGHRKLVEDRWHTVSEFGESKVPKH
jgi:hypothetical protein